MANEQEMGVSLGTIFVLNSVALLLFPFIGHFVHFTQTQFGLWAALSIHDTSSVVGAGAKYGAIALAVGTTVKLTRALWIVPLAIATAMLKKSKAKDPLAVVYLVFLRGRRFGDLLASLYAAFCCAAGFAGSAGTRSV